MICKFKKIFAFSIIVFSVIFIGNVVNAKGTMFIGNGTILNQCTGSTCAYPSAGTTNLRFIGDNTNFEVDHKYTFKLNFSATTSMASPTLTDCGLNINGAYVSPESRNSGRVNYECNSGYTRCDSTYVSTIVYTVPSSLTNVPYFIQCDMTPSATTYTYTNFTMSISDSNGSVIQALDNNTDRIIEINNYNANQNNANRDRNTNKITDKIQDFMNAVGTGINNIISSLTTLGSNIVSGIGTAISNGVNALISAMDGLQLGINAVISAIGDIVSPIVNAIGNGVNNIISAIGSKLEDIKSALQVCEPEEVVISTATQDNFSIKGRLNSDGTIFDTLYWRTSDYLHFIDKFKITTEDNEGIVSNQYYCIYDKNKTLISCNLVPEDSSITVTSSYYYVRFSGNTGRTTAITTYNADNCRFGLNAIFHKIIQFFTNLFDNTIGNVWETINGIDQVEETPISDLLLMPLNLLNKLHTSLSGSNIRSVTKGVHDNNYQCYSYTIPFDFTGGSNTLTLPCINLENYLGSGVWTTIDLILVGLMIYNVGMMVVSFFESWSSLNDTFDSLYTPNHGTYIPRHSGGDRGMFE